jgi:hypothetical protein
MGGHTLGGQTEADDETEYKTGILFYWYLVHLYNQTFVHPNDEYCLCFIIMLWCSFWTVTLVCVYC